MNNKFDFKAIVTEKLPIGQLEEYVEAQKYVNEMDSNSSLCEKGIVYNYRNEKLGELQSEIEDELDEYDDICGYDNDSIIEFLTELKKHLEFDEWIVPWEYMGFEDNETFDKYLSEACNWLYRIVLQEEFYLQCNEYLKSKGLEPIV